MDNVTYIFIAGIGNSGPSHWQASWYATGESGIWVEHASWDEPDRDQWVKDLEGALRSVAGSKALVAHSLGCSLVTEWASEHRDDAIMAALLVAVPDVRGSNFPTEAVGFGAPRLAPLPFPTLVIASEDDPYSSPAHASDMAERLGARLQTVGSKGHINADSGLGDWPEGRSLLHDLWSSEP